MNEDDGRVVLHFLMRPNAVPGTHVDALQGHVVSLWREDQVPVPTVATLMYVAPGGI